MLICVIGINLVKKIVIFWKNVIFNLMIGLLWLIVNLGMFLVIVVFGVVMSFLIL